MPCLVVDIHQLLAGELQIVNIFLEKKSLFYLYKANGILSVAVMPRDMTDQMHMVLHVAADGKLFSINISRTCNFISLTKLRIMKSNTC